jgi:isopentenyl diphosphate isomerase/L-lactate dehydrogenase-like FMN-dependent dehydrogenase
LEAAALPSKVPAGIACAGDYEAAARSRMDAAVFAHVAAGAGDEAAVAANRAAFARWSVVPRVLRGVSGGHTRVRLGARGLAHPFLLAPVASQKLFHPEGELETARAARATDSCMVVSTLATQPVEAIARAAGEAWFQLYWQSNAEATRALARRAEAAGCAALVFTADAPVQPQSLASMRAGFRLPAECMPANVPPAAPAGLRIAEGESRIFQGAMRDAPRWQDLERLVREAAIPVWMKGVMHPDDARQAKSLGVAGLVVSNHGGRVLDAAPASLDALPEIRAAVGPGYPLLFDGGIRSGVDAFKALALGADAVLVGRLQAYGLAVAGALGVAHVVRLLREELELCMALAGCATPGDIGRGALRPC